MGIWSVVGRAINKTLGTKDFMSLDEIIRNQYRFVPSDEVYEPFESLNIYVTEDIPEKEKVHPKKIKILNPGTLRFCGNVYRSSAWTSKFTFSIIKNGNTVYQLSKDMEDYNTDELKNSYFKTDISCDFGDVIYFKLEAGSNGYANTSVTLQEFTLQGTVVNNIYKEVTE